MAFLEKVKGLFNKSNDDEENLYVMSMDRETEISSRISPDSISIEEDYVRSGSNYTRTLICVDFDPLLKQEDIRRLSELSETITITQHVDIYEASKVKTELSRSIDQSNAKLEEDHVSESIKEQAKAEIESNRALLRSLSRNKERMLMFQLMIHVVGKSESELEQVTTKVKNTFSSVGKLIYPITRSKDAFDSFLPINKNKVYDLTYRPMSSEAVSFFFPFHENEIFNEKGIIKGRNIQTNNIIVVDDEEYLNKHAFYVGSTGSGKSTAMFKDMMNKYMFDNRIITIDPKGDYGEIYEALNGEWVLFSLGGGSIINLFDLASYAYDNHSGGVTKKNPIYDKISTITTMFQLMYNGMTDLQMDIMSEILLELYSNKGITSDTDISLLKKTDFPIMEDLYYLLEEKKEKEPDRYENIKEFHETLRAYAIGTYANVFNGYTNVDVKSDLICYDLVEVYNNRRIQKPLYFLLLSSLRDEIMNGDKRATQLYIDEAHIIADPRVTVAMEYLYEMMKVVRSFNCGITTATQQLSDFLSAKDDNRNYGDSVISLAVQQLMLPMQRREVEMVSEEMLYDFSEEEVDFLEFEEGRKESKQGKGFFFVGSKKVKIDIELTEAEKRLWHKDFSILNEETSV